MQVIEKYKPISESQLKTLEEELKITLPDDYKRFLLEVNASIIKTYQFIVNDRDFYFGSFRPFFAEKGLTLKSFHMQMREHLGGEYFSFASDHSNQLFLISLKEKDYGKIYFYRFDLELEDGLILLANSFSEFISILEKHE